MTFGKTARTKKKKRGKKKEKLFVKKRGYKQAAPPAMDCDAPWSLSSKDCRPLWIKKCTSDPINGEKGKCIDFVRQEVKSGSDAMDAYVKNYCATSDDPRCSCVAVPIGVSRATEEMSSIHGPIYCWYKECTAEKLLTSQLYQDAMAAHCKQPLCRLDANDFEHDGAHSRCPEDMTAMYFRPININEIKRHTRFLTIPLTQNKK